MAKKKQNLKETNPDLEKGTWIYANYGIIGWKVIGKFEGFFYNKELNRESIRFQFGRCIRLDRGNWGEIKNVFDIETYHSNRTYPITATAFYIHKQNILEQLCKEGLEPYANLFREIHFREK